MDKKRIAVISYHTCPLALAGGVDAGGMNIYIKETARRLAAAGFEIDIFTRLRVLSVSPIVRMCEGVRVIHIPAGPAGPCRKRELIKHIDEFTGGIIQYFVREKRKYHLIHSHYWMSGKVALEISSSFGMPLIHMFHTLGELKNSALGAATEPALRIQCEKEIAQRADLIIASTDFEKTFISEHLGAKTDRIEIIPCGVDTKLFTPNASDGNLWKRQRHVKRILFVGRLNPIKGLETLVDAMEILLERYGTNGVELFIIGGSHEESSREYVKKIKERALAKGLDDNIWFAGSQPHNRLVQFYHGADVCVFPSLYESFGMAALEAMACGRPVVASRVPGFANIIEDGDSGLLVDAGRADELAGEIVRILKDRRFGAKLGENAVRAAHRFDWENITGEIKKAYQNTQKTA